MAELRQMIEARNGGTVRTPIPLDRESSVVASTSAAAGSDDWAGTVENLVVEAETKLKKAASGHEALQEDLRVLIAAFKEVSCSIILAR